MGEHSRYVFGDHSHPCDSKSTGVGCAARGLTRTVWPTGVDVRFGPKADITTHPPDVRFTPESGHGFARR